MNRRERNELLAVDDMNRYSLYDILGRYRYGMIAEVRKKFDDRDSGMDDMCLHYQIKLLSIFMDASDIPKERVSKSMMQELLSLLMIEVAELKEELNKTNCIDAESEIY